MSARLAMLQMARLAPRVLGASTERVVAFLQRQIQHGGAVDRSGRPDLWYTAFSLDSLVALAEPVPAAVPTWLRGFGDGRGLDLVHLACLARCWAALEGVENPAKDGLIGRIAQTPATTLYHRFLWLGAQQDLGVPVVVGSVITEEVMRWKLDSGAFADGVEGTAATTPVTAAAVVLLRQGGVPAPEDTVRWLRARLHAQGGFTVAPGIPMPDLLSTALCLHTLDVPGQGIPAGVRERCLDYVDSLWTGEAFCATWADEDVDAEYVFYGLLALGHLAT